MRKPAKFIGIAAGSVLLSLAAIAIAQQSGSACCQGMMGQDMMGRGMMGSMPRHHQAMMAGIPAPYRTARNPLPNTAGTFRRGAAVYAQHCASCHGASGRGDGPAAVSLSPPPANLAWFTRMPMSRWDPYMIWTISEGGQQFGTAMPAFKGTISNEEMWSVISYVRHQLGRSEAASAKR